MLTGAPRMSISLPDSVIIRHMRGRFSGQVIDAEGEFVQGTLRSDGDIVVGARRYLRGGESWELEAKPENLGNLSIQDIVDFSCATKEEHSSEISSISEADIEFCF